MTDQKTTPPAARTPGRARRFLSNSGWMAGGIVLTLLLVADPLHIHPVDEMLHRALNHAGETTDTADGEKQLWTCGMHPEVISEERGTCPICGMNLTRLAAPEPANASLADAGERKVAFYRHPHNPTVTSPTPQKDEMGMDFVPVYDDATGSGTSVTIDNTTIQNMNVKTASAEMRPIGERIRTVGYLEYDEERMVTVTTKYSGFVEKVFVNYVGEPVRKGQALFEIYSPELVQTQQELLSAIDFARRMEGAGDDAKRQAEGLVRAARQRLAYWDISAGQVAALEKSGKVIRTLKVTSPANGLVMKRMSGLEGMAVRPGMELFHIADLSSLWLKAELFEDQLARVPIGSPASVTLTYFPGETFHGKVRFIEPQVSDRTRTVALKVEVPNRGGRLRAGMYATVLFDRADAEPVVAVPSLAVLRTGQRNLVIVAEGEGRFSPREVQLGAEGNGWVEIRTGVATGEEIVTSSQFLIDSESNLREAVQKLVTSRQQKVAVSEPAREGGDA